MGVVCSFFFFFSIIKYFLFIIIIVWFFSLMVILVVLCVMEEKGWSGMISVRCGGGDKILVSAFVGATNPFVTRKLPC